MTTKRILVIDDEELLQEVIQASLEDVGGWEVLLASSGMEGISIALSEPLDGILLDVSMPVMDGIETFKKLQEDSNTQRIPVIFLTAKVQPADKARFSELGIAGVIAKPFDPMTLTDQVATLLN
ncbi:MAG: response regulator [Scytonematopsis contorta HA4267-MV1]|jgi:CheY-like chemotaxis protein|nr:response regulator [Scytonematopsis contorta HA4267-MV1]